MPHLQPHPSLPTRVLLWAAVGVLSAGVLALLALHGLRRYEVHSLARDGTPRPVAECMVLLRQTQGECEVGMFTGTALDEWERDAELADVGRAVRAVVTSGGRWDFDESRAVAAVCASFPGRERVCGRDVRATLRTARDP